MWLKTSRNIVVTLLSITIIAITLTPIETVSAQSNVNYSANQLLIVGPESYALSLQKFIDFKASQGISTRFISTQTLNSTFSNGDFVLGLHDYIAQEYQQYGLKYVILVGTYDQVPTKYVYSPSSDLDVADFNYKPTDWYYAVPDWIDAQVGLLGGNTPQIAIGRLPVRNAQELDQTLSKIISAEENKTEGSFVALQDPNLNADSGLNFAVSLVDFNVNLTSANLAQKLSDNVSYVASYSHGTPGALWTQKGSDQWTPMFSCKDLANIKSTFGIMYLVACFTGEIDLKEEGLARALITSPSGPALVIASSRTESLSNYIPSAFWDRFFETGKVGDSFVFSLQSYLFNSAVFSSDSKAFQKYNFYLGKVIYGDVSWAVETYKVKAPENLASSTQPNTLILNADGTGSKNGGSPQLSSFWIAFPLVAILLSCVLALKMLGFSRRKDCSVEIERVPVFSADSCGDRSKNFSG
jgi:hypothetical protein